MNVSMRPAVDLDHAEKSFNETADVLIVEDRAEVAARVARAVDGAANLNVVSVVSTVDHALAALFEHKPRIVLVALGLPDGDGLEVIRAIRSVSWRCESLVFSIHGDEQRVIQAIKAGARGYLLKSGQLDDIVDDIDSVLEGGCPISPRIASFLLEHIQAPPPAAATAKNSTQQGVLTARETEILQVVAVGFKRREIADRLNISAGTVGNHIHRIYQKLEVNSNIEAVSAAKRLQII